jgi:uncharacterized SAM-binding protein YcdF (DUF218 family)
MNTMLTSSIAAFLLPPLNLIVLACIGALLMLRRPAWGRRMIGTSLVLLWIFSMPAVGNALLSWMETGANTSTDQYSAAQAIVVLAGGRSYDVAEYGGDTVDQNTLERLRLAALIERTTKLPLLVTGGKPDNDELAEAELMQKALADFSTPVKWVEPEAKNTMQNATFTAKMLANENVKTIILVTHGWHMPRAKRTFERAGFVVVPAGVGRHKQDSYTFLQFLPSAEGLRKTEVFMHEVLGICWFWLVETGKFRA